MNRAINCNIQAATPEMIFNFNLLLTSEKFRQPEEFRIIKLPMRAKVRQERKFPMTNITDEPMHIIS